MASSHLDLWFASHREVDGISNETEFVGFPMQIPGQPLIAVLPNDDRRPEDYLGEMTASSTSLNHRSCRLIQVACDYDPGPGTQMQIPEHVAGGQGSHEKLLGIVA